MAFEDPNHPGNGEKYQTGELCVICGKASGWDGLESLILLHRATPSGSRGFRALLSSLS